MHAIETIHVISASAVGGALFGSYANVVAWRRREPNQTWRSRISALSGRSRCPGCERSLDWIELLPIAGWVLVSGACRTCKVEVSPAYFLTELVTATISAALAWFLPWQLLLPALVLTWTAAPWLSRGLFALLPAPTKNPLPKQGVEDGTSVGTSTNQLQNEDKQSLPHNDDRLEHISG